MPETDSISTLDLIKRTIARRVALFSSRGPTDEAILETSEKIDLNSFIFSERENRIFFNLKVNDPSIDEEVAEAFYFSGALIDIPDAKECLEEQGIQLIDFVSFKAIRKTIDDTFRARRREMRRNRENQTRVPEAPTED